MKNSTEEFIYDLQAVMKVIQHRISVICSDEYNRLETARPVYHPENGYDYEKREQDMYQKWQEREWNNVDILGKINKHVNEINDLINKLDPEYGIKIKLTFDE